jgi:hypothetical protein
MRRMSLTPLAAVLLLAAAACDRAPQEPLAPVGRVAASVVGEPASPAALDEELRAIRATTARFHSLEQAEKAGYTTQSACTVNFSGGPGVMGIHLINTALRTDPSIDPLEPEMLLYIPDEQGKLRLTGIEYFVWEADWQRVHGTSAPPPSLFGRTFDRGTHGIPPHYELHVWFWAENPSGLFALWNPTLSCPS